MAVYVTLCMFFVLQYLTFFTQINGTSVDITIPVQPVIVGGMLALQCQIQNMDNSYTVKMFRVVNDGTEEITSGVTYQHGSTLGERVFVTQKVMHGRDTVYFMTIVGLSVLDEGTYSCKVYDLSSGDYEKIADDSIDVNIYYLPDPIYPKCQINPAGTHNVEENTNLKLTCISSTGAPKVTLKWKTYKDIQFIPRIRDQDDAVSTEINFRTQAFHDGIVFICEMTSPGFQDFMRTCQIGPITIRKNTESEHKPFPVATTTQPFREHNGPMLTSGICNTKCPAVDKYMILYLSVATIGAGMLSIVFLTTTIIWCCKYNKISAEANGAQRNITSSDGSEPVYVSLQTRPEIERDSMFMTVDDPNSPGNKVTMPKEVFDEFYRSLTLKKRLNQDGNVQV